jgi:hypothetical protein
MKRIFKQLTIRVTEDEKIVWMDYAELKGFYTLSSFIVDKLKKFKNLGLETEKGNAQIPISGIDGSEFDIEHKAKAIRYFINQIIRKGK